MPRPQVSEEIEEKLTELTDEEISVPEHRASFEDRVRILIDQYEECQQKCENLKRFQ